MNRTEAVGTLRGGGRGSWGLRGFGGSVFSGFLSFLVVTRQPKVVRVLAQVDEIEEPINTAQQVVGGDVLVEVEGIKQPVLVTAVLTHHSRCAPEIGLLLRPRQRVAVQSFSTK